MPLVRISLRKGKPADLRRRLGDAIHRALVETIDVPELDRFQILTEHEPGDLVYDPGYLGIARTDDIDGARRACPIDLGPVHPVERGAFRWRITIPADGHLPGAGILPTLIQWADERHPTDTMPESGIRMAALAGAHPEPGAMHAALAALSLGETIKVTFASTPRLAALLRTPRGPVTL